MSQTDVATQLPPAPDVPGPHNPDDFRPAGVGMRVAPGFEPSAAPPPPTSAPDLGPAKTTGQVEQEMNRASVQPVPTLEEAPSGIVYLPGGYLKDGQLVTRAIVRELNGFDEERLSRLVMSDNPAIYVTELLHIGVESLGDDAPTKEDLRSLLIGDRDALWLGIRIASYGSEIEYKLECTECVTDNKPTESAVTIDLVDDLPVKRLDDPFKQTFEVELRRGVAKVKLLDGYAQEKSSADLGKKTQAEINTIMLANSVIEVDGIPTRGEDDVRRLSSQDRGTIMDFIVETQPGPQIGTEIEVHCAKCDAEYPIVLSPPSLFRF